MPVISLVLRRWPWFAFLASAAMLATAWSFQIFAHLDPCHLCLKQREAYWSAGTIALIGVVLDFTPARTWSRRVISAILVLAFLYSLGWAGFHAGVERKWWPGPQECTGGHHAAAFEMPLKMMSCEWNHAGSGFVVPVPGGQGPIPNTF